MYLAVRRPAGDVSFADVPEPLLAIRRVAGDETVLCLFNLGTDNLAPPSGLAEGGGVDPAVWIDLHGRSVLSKPPL